MLFINQNYWMKKQWKYVSDKFITPLQKNTKLIKWLFGCDKIQTPCDISLAIKSMKVQSWPGQSVWSAYSLPAGVLSGATEVFSVNWNITLIGTDRVAFLCKSWINFKVILICPNTNNETILHVKNRMIK